jgi:GntR family transcriptional regulator, transcriptional repressor for pyruvate dehydrogenase complex
MRKPPRSHEVVGLIRARILSGELTPGSRLPSEPRLVEELGVSRTVVREAVSRLQAEGLVETQHGRGSFVLAVPEPTPLGATDGSPSEVLELRLGLESEAAALAAVRAGATDRAAIGAALDALTDADLRDLVEADFRFHRAVAVAGGNRLIVDVLDSLGPRMGLLLRAGSGQSRTDPEHVSRVDAEHRAIAEAVLARDPETARAAMRVHLATTRRRLGQP